jgi:hypothetical protein
MSLLLNGAKTAIIAGTPLQCVEIYQGESYTFPFEFRDASGAPVNITGWTVTASCKWYNATISYTSPTASTSTIDLSGLVLLSPQPSAPTGLAAAITTASTGTGYLYIPATVDGGQTIGIDATPALIAVVTMQVSRTDAISSLTDINKEPIGLIIRYI